MRLYLGYDWLSYASQDARHMRL